MKNTIEMVSFAANHSTVTFYRQRSIQIYRNVTERQAMRVAHIFNNRGGAVRLHGAGWMFGVPDLDRRPGLKQIAKKQS